LIDFFKKEFPYWLPVCRDVILSGKGKETVLIALDNNDNTIGYVMRAMDGSNERFGPFAVSTDMQGKSIGSILFNELMDDMCKRRIYYTYFMWTSGRNIDYYGNWGMKVYRTYQMMKKSLGNT
jgi:predicted N-acetyltransferase YhbS